MSFYTSMSKVRSVVVKLETAAALPYIILRGGDMLSCQLVSIPTFRCPITFYLHPSRPLSSHLVFLHPPSPGSSRKACLHPSRPGSSHLVCLNPSRPFLSCLMCLYPSRHGSSCLVCLCVHLISTRSIWCSPSILFRLVLFGVS
jgi:hypothetical protein